MERLLGINWSLLIDEAIQRRKGMKLTQRGLAALAHVSVPTVSRFERAAKDIQLSSALAILDVLGLSDKRTLVFPDKEYAHDSGAGVTFWGKDGEKRVRCQISREALDDHFSEDGQLGPKAAFEKYRVAIEGLVRRKYLLGPFQSDKTVVVSTIEISPTMTFR